MSITPEQVQKFKAWHEAAWRDTQWADATRQRMERRKVVSREIVGFLGEFTAGHIALAEFRATFDKKTRKEWDVFGLKAMSGAMFLNKLTMHIPAAANVADRLKEVLPAPATELDGHDKMVEFQDYLKQTLKTNNIAVGKVQPGRAGFFVSAWWYVQNPDLWPACYESVRTVFAAKGLITETGKPVEDYFTLRSAWLELQRALGVTPWELDLLCSRVAKSGTRVVEPQPEPPGPAPVPEPEEPASDSTHSEVQGLLAELGQKLGCKVWIAANDQNRQWKGQKLGSFSIPSLPNLNMGDDAQKIISLIDVIWLKGGRQVVAAFEVESTTSIFSGLLRMSDLVTTCPNLNIACFIVIPSNRESLVIKQLSRPTFQNIELNSHCGFFTIESLKQEMPGMMRWVKEPSSIKDLAKYVKDTAE